MTTIQARRALRFIGAGLLFTTGGIHLDLYLTGYHAIPTIGPLFLLQVISAFALAVAVTAAGGFLLAVSGAMFAVATLGGYLLSRTFPLFGFHEVATTAGLAAGLVEIGAFVSLGGAALSLLYEGAAASPSAPAPARVLARIPPRPAGLGVIGLAIAGLVLVLVAAGGGTPELSAPSSKTATLGTLGGKVPSIVIKNFAFTPARLTVSPGEVVEVTNDDQVAHTLTAQPGSKPFGGFDTGNIAPGATKRFVAPRTPGTYTYYCSIHNFMTGVLKVTS